MLEKYVINVVWGMKIKVKIKAVIRNFKETLLDMICGIKEIRNNPIYGLGMLSSAMAIGVSCIGAIVAYTICTATITNNGKKTYTFIEVKGKFKNSSGTILDTDWTYAVGSEGLAPGESASFRLSVDKDSNITKCDLEFLDYDKE